MPQLDCSILWAIEKQSAGMIGSYTQEKILEWLVGLLYFVIEIHEKTSRFH